MLRKGSRFMVVEGHYAGKMGTVYDIDKDCYPEICAILDKDKKKDEEMMFTYFPIRSVIEV